MRKDRISQYLIKMALGLFSCGLALSIGAQQASADVSAVTFSGSSQVAGALSTWTVNFKTSNNGANASLAAGSTVTAVFAAGFVIPATPTIALTLGFVNCSATGAATGQSVVITLANSGGTCALTAFTSARLTIAGIFNPSAGTYDKLLFTVKTSASSDTTPTANQQNEVVSAAPAPTITSLNVVKGSSGGGTVVVVTGTNLWSPSSVTFGGVSGVVGAVTETSISVTTGARAVGVVDVVATTYGGTATRTGGYTYIAAPVVTTGAASGVGLTGATVAGVVNANFDSSTVSVEYGTDPGLVGAVTLAGSPTPVTGGASTNVSAVLSGLSNATTYYYRVFATNSISRGNGDIGSFTTLAGVPTITSLDVVKGSAGGGTVVVVTGTNLWSPSSVTFGGVGGVVGAVTETSISVTTGNRAVGLVDVVVTTSGGVGTLPDGYTYIAAPTVTTGSASDIGLTGATVAGVVNANFDSSTVSVEYGTDPGLVGAVTVAGTPSPVTGGANTNVSAVLSGLSNATTYYYRVFATDSISLSHGLILSFTTDAVVPGAPTIGTATKTGSTTATVAFTAPGSDGGATITSYTATSSPGGVTGSVSQAGSGTITVSGLTPGTAYTFTITATNSAGTSAASAASNSITTDAVPSAPTITAITPSDGSLSVAFTAGDDAGSAITSYKYSTNGGVSFFTRAAGTTASPLVISTLSTDGSTALTNGTSYNIQIRAVNAVGDGAATASTAATPRTVPNAPTSVVGTAGNTQVSLTWSAPVDTGGSAVTDYVVEYLPSGGSWTLFADGTSTSASATVTGLTNGTSYTFRVSATNAAGTGAVSVVSSLVTPRTVPGAPTSVVGTAGNTQVSLTWTAPESNGGSVVTDYVVEFNDGVSWTLFADGTSTSASATVTGLTNGTSYTFRVSATNAAGTGAASTVSAAVVPRTVPNAPTIGTATKTGSTTATVAFTAPGSDGGVTITSFTATSSPGGVTATLSQAGSGTISVTGLTTGTAYTFTVTATNSAGTSAASAASNSITTDAAPTITSLNVVKGSSGGGTAFTVTGTGLTGTSAVTFDGTNATSIVVNSSTSVSGVTPAHAVGVVDVVVTTSGGTATSTGGYTFIAAPSVTSGSASGVGLTGATVAGVVNANFDSSTVSIAYGTDSGLLGATTVVGSPSPVTLGANTNVSVVLSGLSNATTYYYRVFATNTISTVSGSILSFTTLANAATSTLSLTAGDGQLTGNVAVTTNGATVTAIEYKVGAGSYGSTGLTNSGSFVIPSLTNGTAYSVVLKTTSNGVGSPVVLSPAVSATPYGVATISSITPNVGQVAGGTATTITGTNFEGVTAVNFGATAATSFTFNSPTSITATAPAGSTGAVTVTVIAPRASPTATFTYANAPTVESVSASEITRTAANFTAVVNTNLYSTAVTFEYSTSASFTGSTTVSAVESPIATGSGITVSAAITNLVKGTTYYFRAKAVNVVGQNSASGGSFSTMNDPATAVLTLAPGNGELTGTVGSVELNGSTISAIDYQIGSGTFNSTGRTTAGNFTISPLTNGVAVTITLRVTSNGFGGTTTSSATATPIGTPTLTGISVSKGSVDGGTVVVLTGTNLLSPSSVTFGGSAGVVGAVTATSISVTTSSHAVGAVTVSVTTSAGTAVSSFTYTYIDLPATTSVSVSSITSSSARLSATVTPNLDSTTVSFEYSSNANMSGAVSVVAAGSPISVEAALEASASGLTSGTTYYGRLRAVNSLGTTLSTVASFTTSTPAARADVLLAAGDASITASVVTLTTYGSVVSGIEYQVDGGTWVTTGLVAEGNFEISGLSNGTSYAVKIRVLSNGEGSPIESVSRNATPVAPVVVTTTTTSTSTTTSSTSTTSSSTTSTSSTTTTSSVPPGTDVVTTTTEVAVVTTPATTTTEVAVVTAPSTTTSTTLVPVPSGTTTTTVEPDQLIPTPTTTTTSTTVPEPGLVITDIGESRVMQLDVQSGVNGQPLSVEVVIPDASSGDDSTLNLGLSTRTKQEYLDDGFITVSIRIENSEGNGITTLNSPIEIRMPKVPKGAVVGSSSDEITWERIPELDSNALPGIAADGYFTHPDGSISVLTRHLTFFGFRKPQTSLAVSITSSSLTAGSLTVATATGGESEDELQYSTLGKSEACSINENGLIRGGSSGTCSVSVSRGGGSVYMSTTSRTHSIDVVSSITPMPIPVDRHGLLIQFGMLCFALFITIRTAQALRVRISSQRVIVMRDDQ